MSDNPVKVSVDAGNAEADRLPLVDSVILGELLRLPVDGKSLRLAAMQVRSALAQRGLLAAAPAPVGSDPVAWRVRDERDEHFPGEDYSWFFFHDTATAAKMFGVDTAETQPLYTASALSDAHSAGMREGMEKAAQWLEDRADGTQDKSEEPPEYSFEGHVYLHLTKVRRADAAAIRSLQAALDQPKDTPRSLQEKP